MLTHYTAHALGERLPLDRPGRFASLWISLRAVFPDALAVALMPNHIHLALPGELDEARSTRLSRTLQGMAKSHGLGRCWGPPAPPTTTVDSQKMARQLRYILLNPCRPMRHGNRYLKLCSDPLEWPWSTHRDTVGAAIEPWVTPQSLANLLGRPLDGFLAAWHEYVSSDPSVRVDGTSLPEPAPPRVAPVHPLETVVSAALAATRAGRAALERRSRTRRLFVGLAHHQGWRHNGQLAELCGITARSARRLAAAPPLDDLPAAALCLGDPRLRRTSVLRTL